MQSRDSEFIFISVDNRLEIAAYCISSFSFQKGMAMFNIVVVVRAASAVVIVSLDDAMIYCFIKRRFCLALGYISAYHPEAGLICSICYVVRSIYVE